jgi:hypothetical protein
VEVDEEAYIKGYEELSGLEWGSVAASLSDYKTNDDSYKSNGEGEREDGDTGSDGRVVFRDLKIERHIIEEWPDDQALE